MKFEVVEILALSYVGIILMAFALAIALFVKFNSESHEEEKKKKHSERFDDFSDGGFI